jgi:hypothetical protein
MSWSCGVGTEPFHAAEQVRRALPPSRNPPRWRAGSLLRSDSPTGAASGRPPGPGRAPRTLPRSGSAGRRRPSRGWRRSTASRAARRRAARRGTPPRCWAGSQHPGCVAAGRIPPSGDHDGSGLDQPTRPDWLPTLVADGRWRRRHDSNVHRDRLEDGCPVRLGDDGKVRAGSEAPPASSGSTTAGSSSAANRLP